MRTRIGVVGIVLIAASASAQVAKDSVPGVVNFAKVDSTIACAGATTPEGVREVKTLGYRTIVNLRQAIGPEQTLWQADYGLAGRVSSKSA